MAMVTGGEAIVKSLIEEGVDTVFGLPGTHVLAYTRRFMITVIR